MKQQSSATSSPSNSDGYASEYVIVQGLQTTMPPSRSKPPRRPGCFPVTFTVLLVHPNPNRKVSHYDLVRYKTSYELWVNCDDFSCFESGVAAVNRLVDLMNVPFPLQDVQLFWKTNVGFELPVMNWNCMLLLLALLLRDVKNLVRKQEDDNSDERYPYVKLQISKFVKLSKEGLEAARRAAQSGRANGEWVERTLRRPQREMEWRMVVLQSQAIERVKLEGGGQGEEESCGICLIDMCVGSEERGLIKRSELDEPPVVILVQAPSGIDGGELREMAPSAPDHDVDGPVDGAGVVRGFVVDALVLVDRAGAFVVVDMAVESHVNFVLLPQPLQMLPPHGLLERPFSGVPVVRGVTKHAVGGEDEPWSLVAVGRR
nr:Os08g0530801 [Ipomoea batatas]